MTSSEKILSMNYRQRLNTCVLASYAVAGHPFVEIPVLDFFVAYCLHFGLDEQHPERSYDNDFHHRHPGYSVIWNLHHESTVQLFERCRSKFQLIDVRASGQQNVEQRLVSEQSTTLMLFINKSKRGHDLGLASMHSIAVGYSPTDKFFYYDTGLGGFVRGINNLADLGELGDRFLLKGRS